MEKSGHEQDAVTARTPPKAVQVDCPPAARTAMTSGTGRRIKVQISWQSAQPAPRRFIATSRLPVSIAEQGVRQTAHDDVACPQESIWTIQLTPKRSVTIPKRGDQNVLLNGICT